MHVLCLHRHACIQQSCWWMQQCDIVLSNWYKFLFARHFAIMIRQAPFWVITLGRLPALPNLVRITMSGQDATWGQHIRTATYFYYFLFFLFFNRATAHTHEPIIAHTSLKDVWCKEDPFGMKNASLLLYDSLYLKINLCNINYLQWWYECRTNHLDKPPGQTPKTKPPILKFWTELNKISNRNLTWTDRNPKRWWGPNPKL